MTVTTMARGEVRTSHSGPPALRALVRTWTRIIAGVPYGFTAVIMPGGERRYFVSRYNGYCADALAAGTTDLATVLAFGCAWSPVHTITVTA